MKVESIEQLEKCLMANRPVYIEQNGRKTPLDLNYVSYHAASDYIKQGIIFCQTKNS